MHNYQIICILFHFDLSANHCHFKFKPPIVLLFDDQETIMSASGTPVDVPDNSVELPMPVVNPYSASALEMKRASETLADSEEANPQATEEDLEDEKERKRQTIGRQKDGRRRPLRDRPRQRGWMPMPRPWIKVPRQMRPSPRRSPRQSK